MQNIILNIIGQFAQLAHGTPAPVRSRQLDAMISASLQYLGNIAQNPLWSLFLALNEFWNGSPPYLPSVLQFTAYYLPVRRLHVIKEEHTGHIESNWRVNHQMDLKIRCLAHFWVKTYKIGHLDGFDDQINDKIQPVVKMADCIGRGGKTLRSGHTPEETVHSSD